MVTTTNETYVIQLHQSDKLKLGLKDTDVLGIQMTTPVSVNSLHASINGVRLQGDLTSEQLGLARASIHTKAEWEALSSYVPTKGELVIYSDWTEVDGIVYPGLKIGDGNSYVAHLPLYASSIGQDMQFIRDLSDALTAHISNNQIHVSAEDRTRWDNKLNYSVDEVSETLVFNRI